MIKFNVILQLIRLFIIFSSLNANAVTSNMGDLTGAVNNISNVPLNVWFVNDMNRTLENRGIKDIVDGYVYQDMIKDEDTDCDHGRRNVKIEYSLGFNNATSLIPVLSVNSSISMGFDSFLILDSISRVKGYFEVNPSDKTILGCDYVSTELPIHQDIDSNLKLSAFAFYSVKLNPQYVPPSISSSGKPEIAFSPIGTVNLKIGKYDPAIRISIQDGYNDLLKGIYTQYSFITTMEWLHKMYVAQDVFLPCAEFWSCTVSLGIAAVINIWSHYSDHVVLDSISSVNNNLIIPKTTSFFNKFSGTGYTIDITNKLNGLSNIILPDEQTIITSIMPTLLRKNGGSPVVSGDALKQPGKVLYDFLIGNKTQTDLYIQQSKQGQANVIEILNLMLSN